MSQMKITVYRIFKLGEDYILTDPRSPVKDKKHEEMISTPQSVCSKPE